MNILKNARRIFSTSGGTSMIGGFVGGSGTLNYLAKWTPDGVTIGNSLIQDNGASTWNYGAGAVISNTAFGKDALIANTTGSLCTAIGVESLKTNIIGVSNTAVGYYSLRLNTNSYNTAIGDNSLANNSSGSNNTAIGWSALGVNTIGTYSVAIGSYALGRNSTGQFNVAIGGNSMQYCTQGVNNTAIGTSSLDSLTTGEDNVAIGKDAIKTILTTGTKNTAIGVATAVTNAGDTGSVMIGYGATATGSNQFCVGSAGVNAGAVTAEAVVSDATWTVRINGTQYKILLKA